MIVMKLAIILEALGGFSIASKGAFPGVARTRTAATLSMSPRPHHRPRPATSSSSCCARQKRAGLSPNRLRLGQDQCAPTERTSAFGAWIGPASDAPGGVGKPFFANDQIDERKKEKDARRPKIIGKNEWDPFDHSDYVRQQCWPQVNPSIEFGPVSQFWFECTPEETEERGGGVRAERFKSVGQAEGLTNVLSPCMDIFYHVHSSAHG